MFYDNYYIIIIMTSFICCKKFSWFYCVNKVDTLFLLFRSRVCMDYVQLVFLLMTLELCLIVCLEIGFLILFLFLLFVHHLLVVALFVHQVILYFNNLLVLYQLIFLISQTNLYNHMYQVLNQQDNISVHPFSFSIW